MDDDADISMWMAQLSENSPQAEREIWNHFFEKLVQYASRKLGGVPRRDADEEDIALSAMFSLHRGLRDGRFPQFDNRDDLWKILLTITAGKVGKRIRYQMTQKRGSGRVRGDSVFDHSNGPAAGFSEFADSRKSAEFADSCSIECEELLDKLDDDQLRQIAILKLQCFSNEEIADQLSCALRSVERKLQRIRVIWQADAERQI